MSSEHFRSERDAPDAGQPPRSLLTGPVLVKREFGFWHPATLEYYTSLGATVTFPDSEELTIDPSSVLPLRLEPGDLVFVAFEKELLGGKPCRVVGVQGGVVKVAPLDLAYGELEAATTCLLREVRVYRRLRPVAWQKGDRVFAYLPRHFQPPMPLFFPGVVQGVHHHVCVEIDFDDGEQGFVPTTLVERAKVSPGDLVYVSTEERTHGSFHYHCEVLECEEEDLVLQDGSGQTFTSRLGGIAKLPKGYRMVDGKLERIPGSDVEPWEAELAGEKDGPSLPQGEERAGAVASKPESITPSQRPWWKFWG